MSDAVVIGSGPNGLAAAIRLAEAGASVTVLEAHKEIGGGTRTAALTLPGFKHDVCSSVHPMGIVSPFLKSLPLEKHGLKWIYPEASVAHPLDNGKAVLLTESLDETADRLGRDGKTYRRLLASFVSCVDELMAGALAPLQFPKHPLLMARFGLEAVRSAQHLSRKFSGEEAKALIAGCAAHSILPFDRSLTAAVALVFLIIGHKKKLATARGRLACDHEVDGGLFQKPRWQDSDRPSGALTPRSPPCPHLPFRHKPEPARRRIYFGSACGLCEAARKIPLRARRL